MTEKKGPEIVFGLVAAIGTDLDGIEQSLNTALADLNYTTAQIKPSNLLKDLKTKPWSEIPESPEFDRYDKAMTGGNRLRMLLDRGDALALLAVGAIREIRQEKVLSPDTPVPRQAYILRSLKHPAEVRALRNIYGPSFFLIAGYKPRESRKQTLAKKLATSEYNLQTELFFEKAEHLMRRDESERDKEELRELGQNVRDTFPLADLFVDVSSGEKTRQSVERFVQLIFGTEIHTPTRAEYGMFHAQAASLRSAALGRQVGATIATDSGDIIAVGTNEVPRTGGGLYWCEDQADKRDFKLGFEISDKIKRIVRLDRISTCHWEAT